MVKICQHIGFCLYRRSYILWSPVIGAGAEEKEYYLRDSTQLCTYNLEHVAS